MEIDAKRYFKLSLPGRSKTAENELRWLLIAASAYAQAINAASFREGKNVFGTGGSYIDLITREEVENQKKAFEEALSAFFDEVEALRQLTSVHHGEPQTGGTSHTDPRAAQDSAEAVP